MNATKNFVRHFLEPIAQSRAYTQGWLQLPAPTPDEAPSSTVYGSWGIPNWGNLGNN